MIQSPSIASRRMVQWLVDRDEISQFWAAAMRAVPRHLFIPELIYRRENGREGNDLVPLRRSEAPVEWLTAVYSDAAVITQVDDGNPDLSGCGFEVSSSSTQPSVMAGMLACLDVRLGVRVLELGTGTGWNAALLARGGARVTTVEIDREIADQAGKRLVAAGFGNVVVVTGDGERGWPSQAPYDRVLATVGTATVPHSWVEQTREGGRIVVPLTNAYRAPGVVVLMRHDDGTASGRIAGSASFMAVRARRSPRIAGNTLTATAQRFSDTDLHPYLLVGRRASAIAIGQRITGVSFRWEPRGELGTLWFYAPDDASWASVHLLEQPPYPVAQGGPRRVFDDVVAAYRWWRDAGEPEVGDWLVTVTPDGQTIELG